MLRVLHLADLHLGWHPSYLDELADERHRERDGVLKKAVDTAIQSELAVDLVVIAGDLFEHHHPERELVDTAIQQLARLERNGIPVVTAPGNHDELTYVDSVYRQERDHWPGILIEHPMPGHVKSLTVGETRCHIYGLAYTAGLTKTSSPLSEFPRLDEAGVHLAVMHGSLDWDAGDRSLPIDSASLMEAGYDYTALGHIHQHQVHASGTAAYAGAPEAKGFHDPGTGHLTLVDIKDEVEIQPHPLPLRPCRRWELDLGLLESPQEIDEWIRHRTASTSDTSHTGDPADLEQAIIRIELQGRPSFDVDLESIEARLRPSFYYLEMEDQTDPFSHREIQRWAEEPTVRGDFVRHVLTRAEEACDERERQVLSRALIKGAAVLRDDDE